MVSAARVLLRKCDVYDFSVVDGAALTSFVMLGVHLNAAHE